MIAERDRIVVTVCHYQGVTVADLLAPGRKRRVAQARHLAAYLLRERLEETWPDIAAAVGCSSTRSVAVGWENVAHSRSNSPLGRALGVITAELDRR